MENTTYIGLSRLSAMRREMDVVANNMANMNSNAYKGERVMFEEFLKGPNANQKTSFVNDWAVLRDFRAGKLEQTGNTFDFAISGTGYLSIDTPQGRRYTRDGHLRLDADRRLVTSGGHPVLDNRGRDIIIPDGQGVPAMAVDGTINVGQQQVAKIDLVNFENEQELRKTAQGLFATTQEPTAAPATTTLVQGMLEASNIEPIVEMTNMIELLRQYQSTQSLLDGENDRLKMAIQRLGRAQN
ncbi:MAG: flagellar basal-body rod protein FlgF [Ferrovibrio sp.]|uniref:flagellar basal-body rod protein FlgF n=1 Tax=Ferrovibrio sp. TaxID=1917215 RepID=UPI00262E1025|nr:flagellar basal-body rod protein FlgF [Ferrovibrio sp.]MCW0234232.1 flagellar basal-body rod protein FlgF [Ferrovibrio sp.]